MIIYKFTYKKISKFIKNIYNRFLPTILKHKIVYLKSYSLSSIGNVMDDCYVDYKKIY